ncbi:MAG: 5'-nucleotidase C-terminal domain-containing protein [Spirochaetes bacterium]|nr:5'-nucleotidase C-terminal domain-containing protein [Spirochaetota bacterium]
MKKIKNRLIIALLLLSFSIFANDLELKIFFTADSHGRPLKFDYQQQTNVGGMAARGTLLKNLMSDSKANYLILDVGGITDGRAESNLFNGLPDITGMNDMKYNASGIGISEIRKNKEFFDTLNNEADFYFLCANLKTFDRRQAEIMLADPYYVVKIGGFKGIKVGIFSVITEDAIQYLPEEAKLNFTIKDPIETAKSTVDTLIHQEKVDMVIGLTYLGYYPDNVKTGSQTLAEQVSGINLIIDGRNGTPISAPYIIGNTYIYQTGKLGLTLGEIQLKIINKEITDFKFIQHPINYKINNHEPPSISEDSKVLKNITRKMKNLDKLKTTKIASVKDEDLSSQGVYNGETSLGNLICDAMVSYFQIDAAFQNAGGLAEATISANADINRETFKDIIKYENSVYIARVSGKQLKEILEFSHKRIGYGPFLQVGGLTYTYSKSKRMITQVIVGSETLDENKIYKIAFNSWLAQGGDNYQILQNLVQKEDMGISLDEILYEYLTTKKEINPVITNRINIVQ